MKHLLHLLILSFCTFAVGLAAANLGQARASRTYVGSKACAQCHETEYANFSRYAKKAHSFDSVAKMADKLTPSELAQCYKCHTTGYGKPGGFVSPQQTPHLKNAGCEVCHGPGSMHVESEDPEDLDTVSMDGCKSCHDTSRVAEFGFKPMLYGGAH